MTKYNSIFLLKFSKIRGALNLLDAFLQRRKQEFSCFYGNSCFVKAYLFCESLFKCIGKVIFIKHRVAGFEDGGEDLLGIIEGVNDMNPGFLHSC